MHLALYLEAGTHLGGWRLPESATSGGVDWALYKTVARRAEAAKLDMLFVADKLASQPWAGPTAQTVAHRSPRIRKDNDRGCARR